MAKQMYIGVGDKARKVKKIYTGVNGVARKVKKGYVGVNGVARQFWSGATPLGDFAVGKTVKLNVNGTPTEFIIVHKGRPSSDYDTSCDGVWLLMKNIYIKRTWGSNNDYQNSSVDKYLRETLFPLFDTSVQKIIKKAKIPYWNGRSDTGVAAYGSDGLERQIFLLCGGEIMRNQEYEYKSSVLSYFDNTSTSRKSAYYNGTETNWWTRTPRLSDKSKTTQALCMQGNGGGGTYILVSSNSEGVRPCIIMPYETLVSDVLIITGELQS